MGGCGDSDVNKLCTLFGLYSVCIYILLCKHGDYVFLHTVYIYVYLTVLKFNIYIYTVMFLWISCYIFESQYMCYRPFGLCGVLSTRLFTVDFYRKMVTHTHLFLPCRFQVVWSGYNEGGHN